jgi:PhzF family phenazine biosynthesis protein
MVRLPITYVDVFAARPHEGNHLPVVHSADQLSTSTMAAFARRTRQSETSFLQSPSVGDADYRNRIFTVESEIPFAGHPTLGAAAALCHQAGTPIRELMQQTMHGVHRVRVKLDGNSGTVSMAQSACEFGEEFDASSLLRALGLPEDAAHPTLGAAAALCHQAGTPIRELMQQTMHGVHRVRVKLDGNSGTISMAQSACEFGEEFDASSLLRALGLPEDAAHPTLPVQMLSTGLPMIVIPLTSPEPLHSARMDRVALGQALESIESGSAMSLNCYVVAEESAGEWSARSFSLDVVGGEDPATGSAAGPFGAYLRERIGLTQVRISQGVDMGEPSRLRVDTSDGIVVSGDVHIIGTGTVSLPEG